MGSCASQKQKKHQNYQLQNNQSNEQQTGTLNQNQQNEIQLIVPNHQQVQVEKELVKPIQDEKVLVKPEQVENHVKPSQQDEKNGQNFDEDIYINDIMKQFDDLNNLFNQMAQEFDSISQYLLSVSGNQGVPS